MINLTVSQTQNAKYSLFTIRPSDYPCAIVLVADAAKVITIPAGAYKILFSCTGNFYARHNAAAVIPTVDITNGTASTLNPASWTVTPADTVGVIAPSDCILTLEFFI